MNIYYNNDINYIYKGLNLIKFPITRRKDPAK